MNEREYLFNTSADFENVRIMKEKLCFVSKDYENDLKSSNFEVDYELPNGSVIKVGNERFQCCEALLKPSMVGLEFEGVHTLIHDTIQDCPIDIRRRLYKNIVWWNIIH